MKIILLSGMYVPTSASVPKRALSRDRAWHLPKLPEGFVVVIVAVAALLPIMVLGVPGGADLPNHLRFVVPFYESLQAGHLHPAWLAESNYGLGDLRFTVYPPGFYYLLSGARWLTGGWYLATTSTFVLLSIIGGLGAYFWGRSFLKPRLATWAGILYVLAPYRLNELYQASLLSEYAACSILPFGFAFVERICRRKTYVDAFGLAAAYGLLTLTHLPLTLIGSIALALYALFRLFLQRAVASDVLTVLRRLALGAALGLAASSFFWTSMVAELPWIKAHGTEPNPYYDYRLNFLFSPSALTNRNTWYANVLALVLIGFLLPGIWFIRRYVSDKSSGQPLKAIFLVLLTAFLMATPLSRPVWAVIPKLSEIQFPWRWLSVVSLMSAVLVAAGLPQWTKQLTQLRPRDLAVCGAFTLALVFIGTQIVIDCEYINRQKFESLAQDVRGAISFKDYLPVWAREFNRLEKMNANVDAGSRTVSVTSWKPEHRTFHIDAGPETLVRVRTYFYPHWLARTEGRVLTTTPTADGLLQISVPPKASDIELAFERPARVRVFEIVSVASWILILTAIILNKPLSQKPSLS